MTKRKRSAKAKLDKAQEVTVPPGGDAKAYWLVQRLIPRELPNDGSGIYRFFIKDYMGCSEFEYGTVGTCIRRVREAETLVKVFAWLRCGRHRKQVYFVGEASRMEQAAADLQAWLDDELPATEHTEFEEHFTGETFFWKNAINLKARAWLSLENDVFFTLEETYANQILEGLTSPPAKHPA